MDHFPQIVTDWIVDTTTKTLTGQWQLVLPANSSRFSFFVSTQGSGPLQLTIDPSIPTTDGILLNPNQPNQLFTFRDLPGAIGHAWYALSSPGALDITIIECIYRPQE